jgi:hypothetical protein
VSFWARDRRCGVIFRELCMWWGAWVAWQLCGGGLESLVCGHVHEVYVIAVAAYSAWCSCLALSTTHPFGFVTSHNEATAKTSDSKSLHLRSRVRSCILSWKWHATCLTCIYEVAARLTRLRSSNMVFRRTLACIQKPAKLPPQLLEMPSIVLLVP